MQSIAPESLAVRRRRESRREEWTEQVKLAELLDNYLDPSCTFWTSLENKPLSMLSGLFQKRRGVRSGLPDVLVVYRHATGIIVILIELKSRRGPSKAQKQIRLEMLPAGAVWWMARSARAAMRALDLSGVLFRRKWEPPQLQPWEGPFADPTQRLPQHPKVAAERREAKRCYRLRREMREREAAELAAERRYETDVPTSTRQRMPSREAVMAAAERAQPRGGLKSASDRR
jgi:hypothetical protein